MLRTRLHQTGVQQVKSMYTNRSKEKFGYLHVDHINKNCWFPRDVTVVCWWYVGFSPLGTKLYFHVNYSKKDLLY